MKTSSKLLLTLLAIVIVGIFAVNVILKKQMDERIKTPTEEKSTHDTVSTDSDSIAMEKAMENE